MIGVMPAPAASANRCRASPVEAGKTKRPAGGIASSVPPGASVALAQCEKRPSAMRLMATRKSASPGPEQIE